MRTPKGHPHPRKVIHFGESYLLPCKYFWVDYRRKSFYSDFFAASLFCFFMISFALPRHFSRMHFLTCLENCALMLTSFFRSPKPSSLASTFLTQLSIPVCEITTLEKKMTAFVIPNAIQIITRQAKYTFTSFLSRDTTFDVMHNIWRLGRPEDSMSMMSGSGRGSTEGAPASVSGENAGLPVAAAAKVRCEESYNLCMWQGRQALFRDCDGRHHTRHAGENQQYDVCKWVHQGVSVRKPEIVG
jgi:hypothetical protein